MYTITLNLNTGSKNKEARDSTQAVITQTYQKLAAVKFHPGSRTQQTL